MGLLRLVAPYEPPCHCCTSRAFCHRLSVEKGRYIYIDTESAGFFFPSSASTTIFQQQQQKNNAPDHTQRTKQPKCNSSASSPPPPWPPLSPSPKPPPQTPPPASPRVTTGQSTTGKPAALLPAAPTTSTSRVFKMASTRAFSHTATATTRASTGNVRFSMPRRRVEFPLCLRACSPASRMAWRR